MTRIKVDPSQLAQAAQELAEVAERLQSLADEAHAIGSSAPSYDGQFGPQAERLGLEALSALNSQSQRVSLRGSELVDISQAFAEADHRSQSGFGSVWSLLSGWKEKAEEILPSWLMGWLYRDMGQPTPTLGAEATPTPPGHTPEPRLAPTASWTPVPIGTPTAEELQTVYAKRLLENEVLWVDQYTAQLLGCSETGDTEACIESVARTAYDHRGLDFEEHVATTQNNRLPEDSAEFGILAQIAFLNHGQDGNAIFLRNLDMDPGHITNYEPAYLAALKVQYSRQYDRAMLEVEDHREELDAWNDGFLKQLLESPYGAGYYSGSE